MTNKELFIQNANNKHSNKFDYSKFNYTNAKTKSTIICDTHGAFEQTPDKHLQSKYGCPACFESVRGKSSKGISKKGTPKYTKEYVKEILENLFPVISFNCSEYTTTTSNIEATCNLHGSFRTTFHTAVKTKYCCPKCGTIGSSTAKTETVDNVLEQLHSIYNDTYTYTFKDYISKNSKVEVECSIHGIFTKSVSKLLSGQSCPKCKIDSLKLEGKLPGGYCETIFKRSEELKNKQGIIYYLKIGNNYKIGITTNLNQRINAIKSKSKAEVVVIDTYTTTLYSAYLIEQEILKTYKKYRILTEYSTEVFSYDVLDGRILK